MDKFYLTVLLCLNIHLLAGQSVEFGGGVNRNSFFDLQKEDGHFRTEYDAGIGHAMFFSLEDSLFNDLFVKAIFSLDNYNGSLAVTNGGLGTSGATYAEVSKTTLGVSFFPFNRRFLRSGWLNFGINCNLLLDQKMIGYRNWSQLGNIGGNELLDINSNKYENKFTFSITGRVAYKIDISNALQMVPQYIFNLGLSQEFRNLQSKTKSLRQTVAIGILLNLSK